MSDDRDRQLTRRADELSAKLIGWRRQLHQHPELGYEERWTSEFVAERLRALGLEVRTGLAETGVVGVLRAAAATRPAVLLRADMDALPIQEVEGREYGSQIPDRMHACGHDGHMTMLLGAATLVCENKDELDRDVIFCFQPAEEGGGGGRRMIEEGVLDLADVGTVYGLHLWSPLPVGTVYTRPGPMMAGNDEFTACFRGRGGHGALPHTARDPIVAAAQAVTALQSIVARSIDPVEPAVVTVGMFQAGSAPNIIPDEARLEGTLRSFDKSVRALLRERVQEVLESSARGAGCELDYKLIEGYPGRCSARTASSRSHRWPPRKTSRTSWNSARAHSCSSAPATRKGESRPRTTPHASTSTKRPCRGERSYWPDWPPPDLATGTTVSIKKRPAGGRAFSESRLGVA